MGIYDVDFLFFFYSGTAPWEFSDIGAHYDFQKADFVMPEISLKELCLPHSSLCSEDRGRIRDFSLIKDKQKMCKLNVKIKPALCADNGFTISTARRII